MPPFLVYPVRNVLLALLDIEYLTGGRSMG
jgi:hypothetical protein